jgi:hypothetical protein
MKLKFTYIDLNLHQPYHSKKLSTASDATTHEMLKMKEDILFELNVYGQTQENAVLNHTTGLRIDCFCFQIGLRRQVGCGSWRHEQKWRSDGEEGGIEPPTQTEGKTNTRPPSSALMQQKRSITRAGYEDQSRLAEQPQFMLNPCAIYSFLLSYIHGAYPTFHYRAH